MAAKFSLEGGMIPRTVKRMFDQRSEPRHNAGSQTAVLGYRGRNHVVRLLNISPSGAMAVFAQTPHIGEAVTLQMLDKGQVSGHVMWVRDGRIGISYAAPLE